MNKESKHCCLIPIVTLYNVLRHETITLLYYFTVCTWHYVTIKLLLLLLLLWHGSWTICAAISQPIRWQNVRCSWSTTVELSPCWDEENLLYRDFFKYYWKPTDSGLCMKRWHLSVYLICNLFLPTCYLVHVIY